MWLFMIMFHLCLKISKPDDHSWFMKDFGYQVHSVLTLTLFGKGCIQYIFVIYKQKTTNLDEGYIYSNYSRVFNIFIDHLKKGWYICTWWFSILSGGVFQFFEKIKSLSCISVIVQHLQLLRSMVLQ